MSDQTLFGDEITAALSPEIKTKLSVITKEVTVSDDAFDWANDPSIVLHHQPATAIYFNSVKSLVIRQEASGSQEGDPYVMIAAVNTQHFLNKLCDLLGVGGSAR